mgnify:CR=1 FL=1
MFIRLKLKRETIEVDMAGQLGKLVRTFGAQRKLLK